MNCHDTSSLGRRGVHSNWKQLYIPGRLRRRAMKVMEPYTEEANGTEARKPPEDSPLYQRMAVVCHAVIILYSAAFWIQVGVMPVS